jgi:serine protease Do
MSMYDLNSSEKHKTAEQQTAGNKKNPWVAASIVIALFIGFGLGLASDGQLRSLTKTFDFSLPKITSPKASPPASSAPAAEYTPQTSQEDAVIKVVKDCSPAVVSIIITKDMPVYERYYSNPSNNIDPFEFWENFQIPQLRQRGTQRQEVGAGSGFIVSEDGMLITNKHVVSDENADYTVVMADGKKYPAKVMALDPVQDLAIAKITAGEGQKFPSIKLGDSSNLQIGQSVVAIGNALGEFANTVSVGVISGLGRSITAGGGGVSETLDNLIQTDAAINEGNSGGPLLNLKGEVIGVNTAIASGAQNVGFVLPINIAKRDIDQIGKSGKITWAYLGVYYTAVNDDIQKENDLPVNYGAWINSPGIQRNGKPMAAVVAGSPAQKAGLKDQDIILEVDGQKIAPTNTLSQIIAKYNPGDRVSLKVQRGNETISAEVTLGDRREQ